MGPLRFTHALVSRVSAAYKSLTGSDLELAKKQHEVYVRLLRDLGLDVIELPPDDDLPRGVFIEDTAVVCNGIALMAKPKDQNRRKEVDTVRVVLKKELELPIVEIKNESSYLEGGDVLFTGREIFVGLSDFTNEAGARAVANAFPEFPCTPIKISEPNKHLKSFVTVAGPEVLCVSASQGSQDVIKRIEREATHTYQTITVPEDNAANVIYCNGTLIHRAAADTPLSAKVFAEKVDFPRKGIVMSELAKHSTGLSSCALLVRGIRHIRSL
ncbi:N(G),N(G)-dimethylarginine dimethylaminohydrolase 1 [Cimex lectularius]|uniref:Dimethylargininase n=1 Tax=Cimex lectularius TaxID=79782 RepID=A0A8I6SPX5_CIMLE|nr:N(G),N(G)-dimethylarginine dimethylaminohydrolase 1 [Cimex lectularius]